MDNCQEIYDHVVYILGTTASGKSKLAIELAQKFNGVIINSDSMQIYQEYGIMTAKPSQDDFEKAEHRLYGHVPFDNTGMQLELTFKLYRL